jgi:hypothetical protein
MRHDRTDTYPKCSSRAGSREPNTHRDLVESIARWTADS